METDTPSLPQGDEVLFLFPDLTTAIQGSYSQGRLVRLPLASILSTPHPA